MRRLMLGLGLAAAGVVAAPPPVAAAGASLTVPAQVQAVAGSPVTVEVSLTFAEAAPFCTNGVEFTWDGVSWLAELPVQHAGQCVATGAGPVPSGHDMAGTHTVCGTVSSLQQDCKTLTVVVEQAAATSAPGAAAPAGAAAAEATAAGATPAPQAAATGRVAVQATLLPAAGAAAAAIRRHGQTVSVLAALAAVALVFAVGTALRLRDRPTAPSSPRPPGPGGRSGPGPAPAAGPPRGRLGGPGRPGWPRRGRRGR